MQVAKQAQALAAGLGPGHDRMIYLNIGEPDFTALLFTMGLALVGVLLLTFNLWTTNDNTAYAFGVAGAELANRNDKRRFIIIGVIVGIALAVTGVANALTGFLVTLGTVIPPLGGVIIGTYLFVWRRRDPGTDVTRVGAFVWPGIIAYLLGTAAAAFGAFTGIGSPAVQGIIVAILAAPLCHAAARRITGAPTADAGSEPVETEARA